MKGLSGFKPVAPEWVCFHSVGDGAGAFSAVAACLPINSSGCRAVWPSGVSRAALLSRLALGDVAISHRGANCTRMDQKASQCGKQS